MTLKSFPPWEPTAGKLKPLLAGINAIDGFMYVQMPNGKVIRICYLDEIEAIDFLTQLSPPMPDFASELQELRSAIDVIITDLQGKQTAGDYQPAGDYVLNEELQQALTEKQAQSPLLTAIAALQVAANQLIYCTGADQVATTALSDFMRSLLDKVDESGVRAGLGLGSMATQNANSVAITGGTIGGINIAHGVVATPGNVGTQVNGFVAQAANGTPNPNFGAWYQFSSPSGAKRWLWQMLSNADSTLRLDRYSDEGNYLQTVMEVVRSTGAVNCNGNWSFTGPGTWHSLTTFNNGINTATIGNAATINPTAGLTINSNITDFALTINNFTGANFLSRGARFRIGNNNIDSIFLQVVGASNGNACNFSAHAGGVNLDRRFSATILRTSSYTVSTLPSATNNAGDMVYCSNLATGPEYVFSDGSNWRKLSDRAIAT